MLIFKVVVSQVAGESEPPVAEKLERYMSIKKYYLYCRGESRVPPEYILSIVPQCPQCCGTGNGNRKRRNRNFLPSRSRNCNLITDLSGTGTVINYRSGSGTIIK